MAENLEYVQKGFRILLPQFAGYLCQSMSREYGKGWWQEVLMMLGDQARDLPSGGEYAELMDSLDIANCLRLLDKEWNNLYENRKCSYSGSYKRRRLCGRTRNHRC